MKISQTGSPFKDIKRIFLKNTCQMDTHASWELPAELALPSAISAFS